MLLFIQSMVKIIPFDDLKTMTMPLGEWGNNFNHAPKSSQYLYTSPSLS